MANPLAAITFRSNLRKAQQGDRDAQFKVAQAYVSGTGIETDYLEAVLWLEAAVDNQLNDARYILGTFYDAGEGVPRDRKKANALYSAAAATGHAPSSRALTDEGFRDEVTKAHEAVVKAKGIVPRPPRG